MTRATTVLIVLAAAGCWRQPPETPHDAVEPRLVITTRAQRAPAVGHEVTVIGIQTRRTGSELAEVCGVAVEGDPALDGQKVVARGYLRTIEVGEVTTGIWPPPAHRHKVFYVLVDPASQPVRTTPAHLFDPSLRSPR